MKASRKSVLALIGAMAMGAAIAAPSVEIVSVQQQYPWTNTVDIVYNVAGVESETNGYFVVFTPTTSTGAAIPDVNGETSVQVALKGSGIYSTQWFPQTNQQYTACKMTPSVFRGGSGGGKDYMIVDLETGAVTYEPMATQEASNERYQAVEYKTKKLVLRRVPAKDDYYIGEKNNTANIDLAPNTYHKVGISQDFYIAIYELTVAQWSFIVGEGTDKTSTLPRMDKSWRTVRGNALPGAIPTSGVMANLNAKTRLRGFDLPTESMWEIAARAESDAIWMSGNSYNQMGTYANISGSVRPVGSYAPNKWGIYDMFGSGWEYTRDRGNTANLNTLQPNGLVPITSGDASKSGMRGGDYASSLVSSANMRFSARHPYSAGWSGTAGIRVSYFPQ